MKSIFLVFALSVAASEAHVCLVNPPQRGGFPAGSLTVKGNYIWKPAVKLNSKSHSRASAIIQ